MWRTKWTFSLKLLCRHSKGIVAGQLFGPGPHEWLNIEQPRVNNPRADLLARNALGQLRHVELEIRNRWCTPLRFAEYYLGFQRPYGHVEQVMLFASKDQLNMPDHFKTEAMLHKYRILEVKNMDGLELLDSPDWGDNILAMLTSADQQLVLDRIEEQLRKLDGGDRHVASSTFVALSGIIGIEEAVLRRRNLIELADLMENKILAPIFEEKEAKGIQTGMQQGMQKGMTMGREEGHLTTLRNCVAQILAERFGPVPPRALSLLDISSPLELEEAFTRSLKAKTIGEVFGL